MTWFEDLGPCDDFPYGPESAEKLRAVGWLESEHDFPQGETEVDVFGRLCELLVSPYEVSSSGGFHCCGLCGFDAFRGGPVTYCGRQVHMGASNVFLPWTERDALFVAPSLVGSDPNIGNEDDEARVHFDLPQQLQEIAPVVRDKREVLVQEHGPELVVLRASQSAMRDVVSLESCQVCNARQLDREALVDQESHSCHGCLGGRPRYCCRGG